MLRRPRPAVFKYYLYQAADSVGFIWPIFTLFLLWNDLSYTQIGTLSAISAVLVVVFEMPTGYVADRLGRRNALSLGMAAMALSTAGFVVAETFPAFVGLYVLWALSMALQHGTADAWLYATLKERTDAESFTRIRGRGGAVHQLVSVVTMISGGFLYVAHPTYPFAASAVLNGVGAVVVLTMPQNADVEDPETTVGVREAAAIIRSQLSKPSLRAFLPYVALFFGIVSVADTYIQPITVGVLESLVVPSALAPARVGVAIPEEATLGFMYAGFALVAAVASYHAETIRARFGLRRALLVLPVLTAVLFLAPLAVSLLAIPVFFVMKGAGDLSKPLVNQYLNDRTDDAGRATVLSVASMAYAVVRAPLKPLAGFVADLTTPITTVGALGVGFLVVAGVVFLVATPIEADGVRRPSGERAD
ncbi:MAG: MFS family permease [Natronomonas sp.]|jgi:MFS family permease